MLNRATPNKRWNIFARELEEVLALHNLKLEDLATRDIIHEDKVRLLRLSMQNPKHFPILTLEEIELLQDKIGLTTEEGLRLEAAILSTIVEELLIQYVGPETAFLSAENILPLIGRAFIREQTGALSAKRGDTDMLENYNANDMLFMTANDAIGRADQALYLSKKTKDPHIKRVNARKAQEDYQTALTALDSIQREASNKKSWQRWQKEAQSGLNKASQILNQFGRR